MCIQDKHGNKVDYYRMAHRIQEKVCQPTMMTGGQLKDYQVKDNYVIFPIAQSKKNRFKNRSRDYSGWFRFIITG